MAWRGQILLDWAALGVSVARSYEEYCPVPEREHLSCSHPQPALYGLVSGRSPGSDSSTKGTGPFWGAGDQSSSDRLSLFPSPCSSSPLLADSIMVSCVPMIRAIGTLSEAAAFGVSWSLPFSFVSSL